MPRNKYPEETVRKILDASIGLFLKKGYEQTTVLDIVNNMGGLTRGAFYHHFKSKEEVLNAVAEEFFGQNNPFEYVKSLTSLSGLGKIKEMLRFSFESQFKNEHKAIANAVLSLMKDPRFLKEQVDTVPEVARFLVPLIEEGIADGSIRKTNPKALAEFILLQFNLWMIPTIFPCDGEEAYEKILFLKDVFESIGCPIIDPDMLEVFASIGQNLPFE